MHRAPELIQAQAAQGQPDKDDADQDPKPELPFFHASIVPEGACPGQPAVSDGIISFVEINGPAPDFELPDLDGTLHRLRDYRGRIVIVNFWSCECPHAERTDRAIMAMFVQWSEEVVLLSSRLESDRVAGSDGGGRQDPPPAAGAGR